jgi:hypothetical protein
MNWAGGEDFQNIKDKLTKQVHHTKLWYRYSHGVHVEVLNVKVGVFMLLFFASLPDCSQNQTAVSHAQHSLFYF